jgi:hypothetical protein
MAKCSSIHFVTSPQFAQIRASARYTRRSGEYVPWDTAGYRWANRMRGLRCGRVAPPVKAGPPRCRPDVVGGAADGVGMAQGRANRRGRSV